MRKPNNLIYSLIINYGFLNNNVKYFKLESTINLILLHFKWVSKMTELPDKIGEIKKLIENLEDFIKANQLQYDINNLKNAVELFEEKSIKVRDARGSFMIFQEDGLEDVFVVDDL